MEKRAVKAWIRISTAGSWSNISGFTLIELMVVLIILSTAVAMVGPRFSSGFFVDEFKSSLRRLQAGVTSARNKAMLSGRTHKVVFVFQSRDSDSRACFYIQEASPKGTGTPSPEKGGASEFCFHPGVRLTGISKQGTETVTRGKAEMRFLANGLAEPVLVHFQVGKRKHTVAVKPFNSKLEVLEGQSSADSFQQRSYSD